MIVKLRDTNLGDCGTLVSSIRVTAPVFVAGKKGRIVFSGSFKTPACVDWSRFPDSLPELLWMGERTLRIGTGVDDFCREPSWTPGVPIESARLAPCDEFDRGCSGASPCKAEEARPSDRETAPINFDSFDQFTLFFRSECAKGLWIVFEKCRSISTS